MSEIRATTISDTTGTGPVTLTGQNAAKMWINMNGTGTIAIRDSQNVSSITDRATGLYSASFTNVMSDANYQTNVTGGGISGATGDETFSNVGDGTPTSAVTYFISRSNSTGSVFDVLFMNASVHGDLA